MGIFGNLFKKETEASFREMRVRPRLYCAIPTEFIDARGNTWSCKIVDMSESGFGIRTCAQLKMGNSVNIIRPCVEAEVVWARNNRAGLRIVK